MSDNQQPTPQERMSAAAVEYGWTEKTLPKRAVLFEHDDKQIVVWWSILDRVRKAELRTGAGITTKIEGGTPGVLAYLRIFRRRYTREDR